MFDLVSDNWSTIKDVCAALAPILAAIGLRRKALEWLDAWKDRRKRKRAEQQELTWLRANWYARAYKELVMNEERVDTPTGNRQLAETFHTYTVQQACARMSEEVPDFLKGWERRTMRSLA